jgi:hypothetical protein
MKTETIEEVAEIIAKGFGSENWQEIKDGIIRYAIDEKEQDKDNYSEEDLQKAFDMGVEQCVKRGGVYSRAITDWNEIKEQFKKQKNEN